jgi:hypothetical protein
MKLFVMSSGTNCLLVCIVTGGKMKLERNIVKIHDVCQT